MKVINPRCWRGAVTRTALALLILLTGLIVPAAASAAASVSSPTEYEIKAGFLFTFARFVKWPPQKLSESDSPFVIGVVGDESFAAAIDSVVRGKQVRDHTMLVRRVSSGDDLRRCHLLFISRSYESRLPAILADLRDEPVLTVGESDRFIARGGMISFTTVADTIRFEIRPETARKSGLSFDPRLLNLAIIADAGRRQRQTPAPIAEGQEE